MTGRWARGLALLAGFVVLTALSQVGGVVVGVTLLLGSVLARGIAARRRPLVVLATVFVGYAVAVVVLVPTLASPFGRRPLPCPWTAPSPLAPNSALSCVLFRNYARRGAAAGLERIAASLSREHEDVVVRYLDAAFPFAGLPLLPHLSHADGRRVDVALYYRDRATKEPMEGSPSPFLGYWAFVEPRPGDPVPCHGREGALRWNVRWLQGAFRHVELDERRTRRLIEVALADDGVERMFVEPHLVTRLGFQSPRLAFQGCAAARHDDHVHVEWR